MTEIKVYETEAKTIERIAEANDMTSADIIEGLCEYMDELIADWDLVKPRRE